MKKTTELDKLKDILYDKGIPFQLKNMDSKMFKNAPQLFYPTIRETTFDFVCHEFSDGGKDGLLEMMDHRTNEVVGRLTAQDAFEYIFYDYAN